MKNLFTTLIIALLTFSFAFGQQTEKDAVLTTLKTFKQAVIENDGDLASKLLDEQVQILEGGGIESKVEYLSHHFHSDGKFLSSMKREVESRNVTIEGNTAWFSSQTHMWGTYSDRELDLNSLELAVLQKVDGNWKITAIHWSSASRN